jgi:hypothetical protein
MTQPTFLSTGQTVVNYGSDLSLLFDLDPMGAVVTGRLLLSQALVRRWTTPNGRLIDDPHYGYSVVDEINDDLAPTDTAQIGSNMDAEAIKDERVSSCSTSVQLVTLGDGTVALTTTSTVTDGAGPFTLVLQITQLTVTILSQPLSLSST